MVAFPRIKGLTGSIAPIGAGVAAAVAVAFFTLMPAPSLEAMVWNSGIAAIVPAAEPPLAITARAVLALAGGAVIGAVTWSALYLLFGPGGFLAARPVKGRKPLAVRRRDAHPDAPARKPMTAADLGTPMMEVAAAPAEATVPADLDLPLAAFDPGAIPDEPREPVRPVPALAAVKAVPAPPPAAPQPEAAVERIETFELTPVVRRTAPPPQPAASPTIEALLRRLEEGAGRRAARG